MIQHYLKIAFRNLWKYKVQNLIGIIGLAIGISFFTIGFHWFKYETSYDSFYPETKNIYRIYGFDKKIGKNQERLPMILADRLKQEFPEVEKVSMYFQQYPILMECENKSLEYPEFRFVDECFLELFTPKIIAGRTDQLLYTPEDLVITESFARKHWSSPEEAIGKVLTGGPGRSRMSLNVVAVMADIPSNSNFQAEGFRADVLERKYQHYAAADRVWLLKDVQIYVLLKENMDVKEFKKKLKNYTIDNKYNEDLILYATNITEMRHTLGSDLSFNINYIHTFMIAGLLLMCCAAFNFLNLYINRMLQRSREIKLRKTIGANNIAVINLFQTELILQLLFAFLLGFGILNRATSFFEQQFETTIRKPELINEYLYISIITFIVLFLFCFLAKLRFARFSSLTHASNKTTNYKFLRNFSICVQLAICIFFIMSAFIFSNQVSMMNRFDWGFNPKGLIKISMNENVKNPKEITQEIDQLPIVKHFIGTDFTIKKEPWFFDDGVEIDGKDIRHPVLVFAVSNAFTDMFEIPLLKGRELAEGDELKAGYFNGVPKTVSIPKVVITENLYKLMNKEDVIGDVFRIPEYMWATDRRAAVGEVEIVGVIKDFHVTSLQNETYPVILKFVEGKWGWSTSYVKVEEGQEEEAIAAMKSIFEKYVSDISEMPEVTIVEEILYDVNKSENRSAQLFLILALLCTIIAVFGIYSISSSNMERRRKEIAIRKISGASVKQIIGMFLIEYAKLLIAANLIALPLAYYFMHQWLGNYIYKIDISLWMFLPVFTFTVILVILTVLAQVIRAANVNLIEVIKSKN